MTKLVLEKPSWRRYLELSGYRRSSRLLPLFTSLYTNRSLAISHTEEITQGSKTALAYVYCDYKDPRTQSEIEILSSITRQLAEQIDSLPLEVKTFRDKYIEKRSHPSDVERISLVKAISSCFEKTYVFIDALVILFYPTHCPTHLTLLILYHVG